MNLECFPFVKNSHAMSCANLMECEEFPYEQSAAVPVQAGQVRLDLMNDQLKFLLNSVAFNIKTKNRKCRPIS